MRVLTVVVLSVSTLMLSACDSMPSAAGFMQGSGSAQGSGSSQVASGSQTQQFMNALAAQRGSALSFGEQLEVQGLTGATSAGLNSMQGSFLNNIASKTGVDSSIIAAAFPSATKPIGENSAVASLQSRLGSGLSPSSQNAVKAAAALRNNSLSDIKTSLATQVASRVGMSATVVQSLLPLLGF